MLESSIPLSSSSTSSDSIHLHFLSPEENTHPCTTERKHTNLFPQEMGTELTATTEADDCFPVRRLQITDKSKGFINLLGQLTVCVSISDEQFVTRFQDLTSSGDDHVICVIEDEQSGRIIATGSIFIEKKFIRNCGKVGHIEDVVVDSSVRGKQLGQKIIQFLVDHARAMGCYKVILDCSSENTGFYEKCGFNRKEIQMVRYFN